MPALPLPAPPKPPPSMPSPCCNCYIEHAQRNKANTLSCIGVNSGTHLFNCACKGKCPVGRCLLAACTRSHLTGHAGEEDKDWQVQEEKRYKRGRVPIRPSLSSSQTSTVYTQSPSQRDDDRRTSN